MKKLPLTPLEQMILNALSDAEGTVTFDDLLALNTPKKQANNQANRIAVHIKEIRRKRGVKIANVRGVGYQLVK